jgi:hypothetical protein
MALNKNKNDQKTSSSPAIKFEQPPALEEDD